MLDVLSGPAEGDAHTPPPPPKPFAQAAAEPPGKLRVALSLKPSLPVPVDGEVRAAVNVAGRRGPVPRSRGRGARSRLQRDRDGVHPALPQGRPGRRRGRAAPAPASAQDAWLRGHGPPPASGRARQGAARRGPPGGAHQRDLRRRGRGAHAHHGPPAGRGRGVGGAERDAHPARDVARLSVHRDLERHRPARARHPRRLHRGGPAAGSPADRPPGGRGNAALAGRAGGGGAPVGGSPPRASRSFSALGARDPHPGHAERRTAAARAAGAGEGRHLRLRPHGLRPHPRGQRAPLRRLRAPQALPRARGPRA